MVAKSFGVEVPITPVRQQLFRCALPRPWPYEFPVVVEPGGTHWRSSPDNHIVIAKTNADEQPGIRFEANGRRYSGSWGDTVVLTEQGPRRLGKRPTGLIVTGVSA